MFRIERVTIAGFWGTYFAEATLKPDVNIFIGLNGSGKTTFMDLLQGVLRADLRILAAHDFKSITVLLTDGTKQRTIKVTRERREQPVDLLRFQIGTKAYRLPAYSPEMDTSRHFRVRPRLDATFQELRKQIASLVKVASLSVHRAAYEQVLDEEYQPRRRTVRSPIDERLDELTSNLTSYQLALAQQAAEVSADFQRNVLTSILYNQSFDTVNLAEARTLDLTKNEEELVKAYQDLRALGPDTRERIKAHFAAINKSLEALRAFNEAKDKTDRPPLSLSDFVALPLLRRTTHITTLLSKAEAKKKEVFAPVETFLDVLKAFVADKRVELSSRGDLVIRKGDRTIQSDHLSSGEKQLLILLIETLLQRNEPFVFLTDEPELSLHIEWQSQVISSINRLNKNAQVVVATHSPEIAAGWSEHIIDMSEVVRG